MTSLIISTLAKSSSSRFAENFLNHARNSSLFQYVTASQINRHSFEVRSNLTRGVYLGFSLNTASEKDESISKHFPKDHYTNVSETIINKIGKNLHNIRGHPICQLKERIQSHLSDYTHFDDFSPIVPVQNNFDRLLVRPDHPGRSKSDSFYFNKDYMLRTHTTTHELDVYEKIGIDQFTITADVYRRDEIDSSHYPVFHQMECVRLFEKSTLEKDFSSQKNIPKLMGESGLSTLVQVSDPTSDLTNLSNSNIIQDGHDLALVNVLAKDMKNTLNQILYNLFGGSVVNGTQEPLQIRWIEAFFPFTSPSWEVEVFYRGSWLEVLGCGILQQEILNQNGRNTQIGWACGMGLERLAMVLHEISDIRLFWSQDPRFLEQFTTQPTSPVIFRPFSKHPPCVRDVAFWCSEESFEENNLSDLVRDIAGDLVESIDSFTHPKTGKHSKCYRIVYRSMDRNVTNEEINLLQEKIRENVQPLLNVELRNCFARRKYGTFK